MNIKMIYGLTAHILMRKEETGLTSLYSKHYNSQYVILRQIKLCEK